MMNSARLRLDGQWLSSEIEKQCGTDGYYQWHVWAVNSNSDDFCLCGQRKKENTNHDN